MQIVAVRWCYWFDSPFLSVATRSLSLSSAGVWVCSRVGVFFLGLCSCWSHTWNAWLIVHLCAVELITAWLRKAAVAPKSLQIIELHVVSKLGFPVCLWFVLDNYLSLNSPLSPFAQVPWEMLWRNKLRRWTCWPSFFAHTWTAPVNTLEKSVFNSVYKYFL